MLEELNHLTCVLTQKQRSQKRDSVLGDMSFMSVVTPQLLLMESSVIQPADTSKSRQNVFSCIEYLVRIRPCRIVHSGQVLAALWRCNPFQACSSICMTPVPTSFPISPSSGSTGPNLQRKEELLRIYYHAELYKYLLSNSLHSHLSRTGLTLG